MNALTATGIRTQLCNFETEFLFITPTTQHSHIYPNETKSIDLELNIWHFFLLKLKLNKYLCVFTRVKQVHICRNKSIIVLSIKKICKLSDRIFEQ